MKLRVIVLILSLIVVSCSVNRVTDRDEVAFKMSGNSILVEVEDSSRVKFTSGIPVCPYCYRGTVRSFQGGEIESGYFVTSYNESGKRRGASSIYGIFEYYCYECGRYYTVIGSGGDWEYRK